MENELKKISGYYSSTDKNGAGMDEVGGMEMEESGRREREIEARREIFLVCFL